MCLVAGLSLCLVADSVTIDGEKRKSPGRPSLKIPVEMPEELPGLGFSWTRIAEMRGVSRWTVHRRVAQNGLENTRDFDDLPIE